MPDNTIQTLFNTLLPAESRWFLVCLLGGVAFALLWRVATAPRRRTVDHPPLTPVELACLRSREAPVVAALAILRAGGHITAQGKVDGARPLGPEADWFTRAVLREVLGTSTVTVLPLIADLGAELDRLEDSVAARGYLRSGTDRWRMRVGAAPITAVSVAGAATALVLIVVGGRHEGTLIAGVLVPSILTAALVVPHLWRVARETPAGGRLLRAERDRLDYLAPTRRPAFATYGAAAVGLSVAVFGTAALWQLDGDFAGTVRLAGTADASGTDGGSCGASCGGDGGGGCGGGCGGCGGCGG